MKKKTALILIFVLAALVKNSQAISPMPEDVKPGPTATICTIYIVCTADHEKEMTEDLKSTFAFEASHPKKDVLEWVTRYVHDKMNERNVTEFEVDCRFPK